MGDGVLEPASLAARADALWEKTRELVHPHVMRGSRSTVLLEHPDPTHALILRIVVAPNGVFLRIVQPGLGEFNLTAAQLVDLTLALPDAFRSKEWARASIPNPRKKNRELIAKVGDFLSLHVFTRSGGPQLGLLAFSYHEEEDEPEVIVTPAALLSFLDALSTAAEYFDRWLTPPQLNAPTKNATDGQ